MTQPARPVSLDLRRLRLPLRQAHVAAHGAEAERDVVVVAATFDDGLMGWGECPTLGHPTYTSEYTGGAWAVLRDELAPAWLAGVADNVVGHASARWALETAALDHRGRCEGRSMAELLAPETGARAYVHSNAVIPRGDVEQTLARVEEAVAAGVASVKVKLIRASDVATVEAVRDRWPALAVAADANGSLDPGDHRFFEELDHAGLSYLEQPLPADALVASAALVARLRTPVVLDESVTSPPLVETVVSLGAANGVNAKPGRLGLGALAVARAARPAGLSVLCGGMLETGIGRAAALAVAAQVEFDLPADLGPSSAYFAQDLTPPFVLDDQGRLAVPAEPGLGVGPDRDRLEDATVDRLVLAR